MRRGNDAHAGRDDGETSQNEAWFHVILAVGDPVGTLHYRGDAAVKTASYVREAARFGAGSSAVESASASACGRRGPFLRDAPAKSGRRARLATQPRRGRSQRAREREQRSPFRVR